MKNNSIFLILFVLLITSCAKDESKNVNQDSIFVVYELNYSVPDDITTARATFRFGGAGGTILELSDPANVTFNGEKLLYNSVTGIHKKEFAGFIETGTYVYTDLDDNVFTNTTPVINEIDFPDITSIDPSSSYVFTWVGEPVQTDETITLTIDGSQQGNFETFSTSTVGETQLVLSVSKLQNLGTGNASCALQRAYNVWTVDEGTSEGGRMSIWYTTNKVITISQ